MPSDDVAISAEGLSQRRLCQKIAYAGGGVWPPGSPPPQGLVPEIPFPTSSTSSVILTCNTDVYCHNSSSLARLALV